MKRLITGSVVFLLLGCSVVRAEEIRTLPPSVYAKMKGGDKLEKLWISPDWDRSTGFVIGKVSSEVDGFGSNTIDYFPSALKRVAMPGSVNVLNLTVVDLTTVDRGTAGFFSATMAVEGQVVGKDGQLLFAFRTRDTVDDRESVRENCRGVMDKITWSIFRDLGKPFQQALEKRDEAINGVNPSGLVPPPPAQNGKLSVGERLMQLDNLRKSGIITEEDYRKHKEEILKSM